MVYALLIIVLHGSGVANSWKIQDYPDVTACEKAAKEQVAFVNADIKLFHDSCEVGGPNTKECKAMKLGNNYNPRTVTSVTHSCAPHAK